MGESGAELLVESLVEKGIDRVYGLHGGHLQRIFDLLPKYGVDVITTRDERAAAYMAHAHYLVTGEIGVALATAGPGVANALTGVANAQSYQVPLLLIGGSASIKQFERIALQEMEQEGVYDHVTNWSGTVFEAERIPEYVDLALRKAAEPRPGPSFLNIPMDVQNESVSSSELENGVIQFYPNSSTDARPHPSPTAIEQSHEIIAEADRPAVISGIGVFNSGVDDELERFIEQTNSPYLDTAESRGYIPGNHPLNVNAARSRALGEADVVILVGKRFDFTLAYGSNVLFNNDAEIVQIDADAGEIGRNRPVDIPVIGDEKAALQALIDRFESKPPTRDTDWVTELQEKDKASREGLESKFWIDDETVHPWRLCAEVSDRLEKNAYVACDGGDILSFGRIALEVDAPGHWFTSGPFGCLGSTVAFATAAALLEPDRQVISLIGDGSFGFNAMEVDTAARHGADVTYVIANNAAWNIDRYDQKETFDNVVGTELQSTRYDKLAEAVHGHGEHVETLDELGEALDRAIAYEGLSIVNVVTQRDVASPDFKQGMTAHENLEMPDLQLLQPWDAAERRRRGQDHKR